MSQSGNPPFSLVHLNLVLPFAQTLHRFLAGSARIVDDFRLRSPRQQIRGHKRRKRVFEAAILPVSTQLLSVEKNLDYLLFPDNTPEKVQHLVDNLQSVRLRLQALEATYTAAESESPELMRSLDSLNEKWRKRIRSELEKWAQLEQPDNLIKDWSTRSILSQEMEQRLGKLQQDKDLNEVDTLALRNIYAVIGSAQSLLDAMKELGDSMKQIKWNQWAAARF
ncbi:MAG: hypothetical protein ABFS45_20025 [Pseudomonadota bacterium]